MPKITYALLLATCFSLPVTASSVTKQAAIVYLSDVAERPNRKKK